MMKEKIIKSGEKRRGSILALAAAMVIILFMIGLGLIRLGSNARLEAARAVADISARAAADAGLTEAARLMNKKLWEERVWDNSTLPVATNVALPNCDARYSFKIEGGPASGFVASCTGRSGIAERKVCSRLSVESLWFGIGVKQNVTILSKTTFSTLPAGSDFTIRTNSTAGDSIKLYPDTFIPGDVIVGPGGDTETVIDTKKSTVIAGDTYAADQEIEFPDVTVPGLPYKGVLPGPDPMDPNAIRLRDNDSGIYGSITLGQGKKLVIDGKVTMYVKGGVRLHQGSELRILDNATLPSLTLYLGQDMQADQGSMMITENFLVSGTRLKIFGTNSCTSIILMNSGDLSAAIYAPYADLQIKNSGTTYGSFTGNNLEMKNSGTFVFDTRLLDLGIDDEAAYIVQRWWEE